MRNHIRPEDNKLLKSTRSHEGFRSKPHTDTAGNLTIGYGTNLSAGITIEQGEVLMREHYASLLSSLAFFGWYAEMSANRQRAIAEMCYQLGMASMLKFKRMLAALELGDYERASMEMLDSHWFEQTPNRAKHCAKLMRDG